MASLAQGRGSLIWSIQKWPRDNNYPSSKHWHHLREL